LSFTLTCITVVWTLNCRQLGVSDDKLTCLSCFLICRLEVDWRMTRKENNLNFTSDCLPESSPTNGWILALGATRRRGIYIYTILKAQISNNFNGRHASFFTNNPSQLFQINIDVKRRPTWARCTRATTMAHARHAGLLTVLGQPVSPSIYLIKSA
jgi:hypothetical protein